ncbi:hypothetical protein [uncultured Arthrobacter sp.]|nr:hypothetical protein [uncultured Arthrobacter sp.]
METTLKTPATVRELGDLAHSEGVTPSEYLNMLDAAERVRKVGQ